MNDTLDRADARDTDAIRVHARLFRNSTQAVRLVVALRGDTVRHEVHRASHLHRLIVNGEEGPWISRAEVASVGIYRASTDYFRAHLPEIFIAVDLVDGGGDG